MIRFDAFVQPHCQVQNQIIKMKGKRELQIRPETLKFLNFSLRITMMRVTVDLQSTKGQRHHMLLLPTLKKTP